MDANYNRLTSSNLLPGARTFLPARASPQAAEADKNVRAPIPSANDAGKMRLCRSADIPVRLGVPQAEEADSGQERPHSYRYPANDVGTM